MTKRPFMARFEWWPDVRYWGGYPLAVALVPAGSWGVWYELWVLGEICFHLYWGVAALITAGVMHHKGELEDLVQHLPRRCKRAFKNRVEAAAGRASRRAG